MFYSTQHWMPILNGRTGYAPAAYPMWMRYADQLPGRDALRILAGCADLRWLLVHAASRRDLRTWDRSPDLVRRGIFAAMPVGVDGLYEVSPASPDDCPVWSAEQEDGSEHAASDVLAGSLSVLGWPEAVQADARTPVTVVLRNGSSRQWPGPRVEASRRVELTVEWQAKNGKADHSTILLPRDVAPGGLLRFPAWITAPRVPGSYRLRVSLVRGGSAVEPPAPLVWERAVRIRRRRQLSCRPSRRRVVTAWATSIRASRDDAPCAGGRSGNLLPVGPCQTTT
jgi:hypothetical protein